jgi:Rps23 Pro-64 3,4-dihydroxylase Tpa1-like proline 4-hydroxylase
MTQINSALDARKLARAYKRTGGRMQIREILAAEDAEWIWDQLANHTPWGLVYNVGGKVEELSNRQVAALSPQQVRDLASGVVERAKTQYQFLYHFYPLTTEYFNTASQLPILRFYEFLNRPGTLDWFRALTGRQDIRWVHAQATLYAPGDFLKSHSDLEPHNNRRAVAFVLNFTRLWERDWGGYLQFFNDRHDVELAWRPTFNSLNIFSVPHDHSVEMVAPFASGRRFAITGWLRTDDPPGPIGRLGQALGTR